jgi:hypothetical protein
VAIGSGAEIGVTFTQDKLGDWLNGGANEWRNQVGDSLLGGYAQLDYVTNHEDLYKAAADEAIQMFPMRPYSENDYKQVRANVLAWWHTRGIILNEKDGGNN